MFITKGELVVVEEVLKITSVWLYPCDDIPCHELLLIYSGSILFNMKSYFTYKVAVLHSILGCLLDVT